MRRFPVIDDDEDFDDDGGTPAWRIRHRSPIRQAFDNASPAKLFVLSFVAILALLIGLPLTLFVLAFAYTELTGT